MADRVRIPPPAARQARADLRALAASLEEAGVASLPVGVLRWNHRRRNLDGKVNGRPLPYRRVRQRAWLTCSDDTSATLAVTSSGILRGTALLETGNPPSPGRPTLLLAGHGPGVKFLSCAGGGVGFGRRPLGPLVAFVQVVGWGYEYTEEIALDRLIVQTMAAYTRDPLWYLRPNGRS
jgi:hypothetical protein